jgi:uncharacterized protein
VPKAVVDTNVFVSALIQAGTPKNLVEAWLLEGLFVVVYPQWLIHELRRIPSKRRLSTRIQPADLQNLISLIEEDGFLVEPEHVPRISRDAKDDVFLACALAAQAEFLVTGDRDLLCLGEYKGVRILSPAQFLKLLAPQV